MPKMICLYQTRPDKEKTKLLLRPQTLVVSAPRSSGEYLDFGDFKILSKTDIQNRKSQKSLQFRF